MATPEIAELPPGTQLGRYRIEGPISSGAMGAVYRAHNIVSDTDVAIKRMLDTTHAQRFEIEARLLAQLEHPRVVKVLDHFQDSSGTYYIVMDLIKGLDLGRALEERGDPGLPVAEVLEYARQTCEALQYVHAQQIVHRDVKPQNLICDDRGIVLVDFGVATQLDATDTGTVGVGTPRFMAPEVFAGGAVSARSDVFSLGATVWNLLSGSPPVYADDTKLAEQVPGVTPELEQTLRSSLEIIPERRIASVQAFAAALGAPLSTSEGASLATSVDQTDASRSLMEGVVRTAAGIFEAAAASVALVDRTSSELVFQAAWGAGAREIVGVRLPPDMGIAGAVVASGEGQAVPDCRSDPRFAAQIAAGTGYVPHTMVVVPLKRGERTVGVLSVLDRRDGSSYGPSDVMRAELFAELAVTALAIGPGAFQPSGVNPTLP
ncbi:MAG: eukaryotic-like serine/threonine-protein kinase [Thermoleophilaceae bacterium]|jgi:GAF domain-containing protein|nr:eukaryotic-like serine/threonine-protein kinase [Thermoleophilaceae bacterium]